MVELEDVGLLVLGFVDEDLRPNSVSSLRKYFFLIRLLIVWVAKVWGLFLR